MSPPHEWESRVNTSLRSKRAPHRLQIELGDQFPYRQLMVRCDRLQNASEQSAGFQRTMIRDRDVVSAADCRGKPDVRSVLPHPFVPQYAQRADQLVGCDVTRNFHTASASSRTKCNRMIPGIGPAAPSPK